MKANNRVCKVFGITYPIIQGGMVWCSGWKLVSAVTNAGGLGLIGAGSMTIEEFRHHVDKCTDAVKGKPFGVNVPLAMKDAAPYMEYVIEKKVPIVFTSAGSPKLWTSKLQQKNVKVAHVVPNSKLALKCAEAGVNVIAAEGFEAGGHNGLEEITTMTLIPQVHTNLTNMIAKHKDKDALKNLIDGNVPLLAAGGIASGQAIAAAMALGADGVQVGTRFAITQESSCSDAFKQRCIESKEGETWLSMKKWMPTRLILNKYGKEITDLSESGAPKEKLMEFRGMGRTRRGMFEGDIDEGELEIGQIASAICDVPTVAQVMERMVKEYNETAERIGALKM